MWICFYHSASIPLHAFSICSQKHCIGYLKLFKNGMLHIISTIFSLSFLQTLTLHLSPLNSIVFCLRLVYQRPQRKMRTDVLLFILVSSSIPLICASLFRPIKNGVQ